MRSCVVTGRSCLSVVGNTYFNFLGQLLFLNLFFYGLEVLRLDEMGIGLL